jgi:Arc/MetJ-type ribon-helix-helix transcriptional regulator
MCEGITEMPTIRGKPKKQIGYKIPADLGKKVDELIDEGIFSSQADIITTALREFFIRRDLNNNPISESHVAEAVEKYLEKRKER